MYYRACSNGKWETPKQLLTNVDLDGILYTLSDGSTGIEAGAKTTRYRLQLISDGRVMLFISTNGGASWSEGKTIASYN